MFGGMPRAKRGVIMSCDFYQDNISQHTPPERSEGRGVFSTDFRDARWAFSYEKPRLSLSAGRGISEKRMADNLKL